MSWRFTLRILRSLFRFTYTADILSALGDPGHRAKHTIWTSASCSRPPCLKPLTLYCRRSVNANHFSRSHHDIIKRVSARISSIHQIKITQTRQGLRLPTKPTLRLNVLETKPPSPCPTLTNTQQSSRSDLRATGPQRPRQRCRWYSKKGMKRRKGRRRPSVCRQSARAHRRSSRTPS